MVVFSVLICIIIILIYICLINNDIKNENKKIITIEDKKSKVYKDIEDTFNTAKIKTNVICFYRDREEGVISECVELSDTEKEYLVDRFIKGDGKIE